MRRQWFQGSSTAPPPPENVTLEYSSTLTLTGSKVLERDEPFSKKYFPPFPSKSSAYREVL